MEERVNRSSLELLSRSYLHQYGPRSIMILGIIPDIDQYIIDKVNNICWKRKIFLFSPQLVKFCVLEVTICWNLEVKFSLFTIPAFNDPKEKGFGKHCEK